MTLLTLLLTVSLAAQEPILKPSFGAALAPYKESISLAGQTFEIGLRVRAVGLDTPAFDADLRTADIIVKFEGFELTGHGDTLEHDLRQWIEQHQLGDQLKLLVYRVEPKTAGEPMPGVYPPGSQLEVEDQQIRVLFPTAAKLRPNPEMAVGARRLPTNDQIFAKPIDHVAEEQLADALISEYDIGADYQDLRQRLAKIVKDGGAFRLSRFAYAMREPWSVAELSRDMGAVPGDLSQALAHAAGWIDLTVTPPTVEPLKTGLTAQEHAEQIEQLLTRAIQLIDAAFVDLTADERQFLHDHLTELGDHLVHSMLVLYNPDTERGHRVIRWLRLAAKVDRARLIEAGMLLSSLFEPRYLAGLAEDLADSKDDIILSHTTSFGPIIFSGGGRTWFKEPTAVIVDLGGDDFYANQAAGPFNIVIDLGGNDTHQATFEYAQGFGRLGVSLLYDAAGDDTYIGQRWSQGSAALGVGVLWDRQGDDHYFGQDLTQAAALVGVGLVIDEAGDDHYHAPHYAQALGLPGGYGSVGRSQRQRLLLLLRP